MEENKVASLVRPLEHFAETNPGLYRLRVGLLAALGYVYLFVIVFILLAIVAVTLFYVRVNWLALKVLWIPLALVGLVLRSLWITLPEPDGIKLEREQAPGAIRSHRRSTHRAQWSKDPSCNRFRRIQCLDHPDSAVWNVWLVAQLPQRGFTVITGAHSGRVSCGARARGGPSFGKARPL